MAKASESAGKLAQREYAAIHLAVPDSGTAWLDEMIRKSHTYGAPIEARQEEPDTPKPVSPKKTATKKTDD